MSKYEQYYDEWVELYTEENPWSPRTIANYYGCDHTTVRELLKKRNVYVSNYTRSRYSPETEIRFETYTDKGPSCWLWTGATDKDGYGQFKVSGVQFRAHRWSYEHHVGPIPEGMLIRHSCHNPSCVNPEHLETGTHADNAVDRENHDMTARGMANGNSKLTPTAVRHIRQGELDAKEYADLYDINQSYVYKLHQDKELWRGVE